MTAWQVYRQPRLILILLMGFASGLPLALTGATLALRLTESKVSLTAIGLYALVQLSYNFKVLWAPLLDFAAIPLLTAWLGRRRSWLIVIQLCLAASLIALGFADPALHPHATVLCAVIVAFFSASQDIVIDAFRVELLSDKEQGGGAAATQMGYQLGMIMSGAGALHLATAAGWRATYDVMALILLVIGMGSVLAAPKLEWVQAIVGGTWRARLTHTLLAPLLDFVSRPSWGLLMGFIVLFNLGNALAGHMAGPFYIQLGFSKNEIGDYSKVLGTVAGIGGTALGGVLVYRLGILRSLVWCVLLRMGSTLLYVVQAKLGHSVAALACTVTVENLAIGMGGAAFVAFLSTLCDRRFTATQYALLSGLALLGRNLFAAVSGALAQSLGWPWFFTLAAAMALPGLIALIFVIRSGKFPAPAKADAGITSGS